MSYKKFIPIIATLIFCACKSEPEVWEKSPGLTITVFKDEDNGKPYLTTLYENFGEDTIEKIRFQLITETKGHWDTTWREIDPPKLLRPKDRHAVPRHIGEDTLAADYVGVGKVLAVKLKD